MNREAGEASNGRAGGAARTREAILAAAQELFAHQGFEATTMRAVAGAAGVDPALISYYFGNKQGLFQTALNISQTGVRRFLDLLDGCAYEDLPQRLAELSVFYMEHPESRITLLMMAQVATGNCSEQTKILQETVDSLYRLAREAFPFLTEGTFAMMLTQIVAITIARHQLRIAPLADVTPEELADLLRPSFENALPTPPPSGRWAQNRPTGDH